MTRYRRFEIWLAERTTDWLTSPGALIHGVLLVLLWPVPFVILVLLWPHLSGGQTVALAMLGLMDALTVGSWVTQFPLAYSSRRGEAHLLKLMRLVLALAEEIQQEQGDQGVQLDELEERLDGLA